MDERSSEGVTLSVVVVTYNEQERIRECLQSVLTACREFVSFEVILVDSNSTDRTVEIATEFPVTVYRIPDEELLTPAAGRYVGTQAASGELLLFVDGDMVLQEPWLREALRVVRRDGVGAVDGHLNTPAGNDKTRTVDSVRGVALYDRPALESVGGFDPYLQSLEDIHLGFKLTANGHRLVRLPTVAGHHPEAEPFLEPLRRWRNGYLTGTGQILRYTADSPRLLAKYLYRFRHRFVVFLWLCVGLGSLLAAPLLIAWVGLSLVGFAAVAGQLGVLGAMSFLVHKLVSLAGMAHGLTQPPQSPESFPMDRIERLQQGQTMHGLSTDVVE